MKPLAVEEVEIFFCGWYVIRSDGSTPREHEKDSWGETFGIVVFNAKLPSMKTLPGPEETKNDKFECQRR